MVGTVETNSGMFTGTWGDSGVPRPLLAVLGHQTMVFGQAWVSCARQCSGLRVGLSPAEDAALGRNCRTAGYQR